MLTGDFTAENNGKGERQIMITGIIRRIRVGTAAVMLFLLMPVLAGCTRQEPEIILSKNENESEEYSDSTSEPEAEDSDQELQLSSVFVYVCGAVQNPGVYELPNDSRVYQAIEMAGGFTAEASLVSVNQAEKVEDGQQVRIPTLEEASGPLETAGQTDGNEEDPRININTADSTQLMQLSGIGETRALDIISYREQNGSFDSVEEIKKVSGIGDKTYEKIKDDITVS